MRSICGKRSLKFAHCKIDSNAAVRIRLKNPPFPDNRFKGSNKRAGIKPEKSSNLIPAKIFI